VPERLTHQRSKGPVSTPAQRLVELQNALTYTEQQLADARSEAAELAEALARFHRMSDTSFGGIPMAQIAADMILWEAVLNENPVDAIFEIGTWQGGFSWWLYAQSLARDIYFQTYDAIVPERSIPTFYKVDVFAASKMLGKRFRAFEPCVVFCDGGNKPRELNTFAAELRDPASLLLVHDWGDEIGPADVPDSVVMVYREFCEDLGSITRVFRPKERDA
jgi:hypothetical protein